VLADVGCTVSGNTIIGAIVTNANINKSQANKLASVTHDGIARAVRPSHSIYDGDTIFTMATGEINANQDAVGLLAVHAVEQAFVSAVRNDESLCGFPAYGDIKQN
jgi:L-aminopeptidase/D-esterase-like protein